MIVSVEASKNKPNVLRFMVHPIPIPRPLN
jgi:hypothetical protein